MRNTIKIAIVDDQPMFRQGLKMLMRDFPMFRLISEVNCGKLLIETLNKELPQIVILDSEIDGEETAYYLNRKYPSIRVIVPSVCGENVTSCRNAKRELHPFLEKSTLQAYVSQMKLSIKSQGCFFFETMIRIILEDVKNNIPIPEFKPVILSGREKEVVLFLCHDKTNKEIATLLSINERTIETYRRRIMDKIGAKSMAGVYAYAVERNWLNTIIMQTPTRKRNELSHQFQKAS